MKHKNFIKGMLLALVVCILDQLSKWWMFSLLIPKKYTFFSGSFYFLPEGGSITLTPFLNLVTVWNTGISFGILAPNEYGYLIFSLIAIFISIALAIWLFYAESPWQVVPLALIIGGAIGNVIDRVRFGAVFDFVDLHIGMHHWPAFNLADSTIVIGALLLCYDALFLQKNDASKEESV